jgi:hypothetical protein
MRPVNIRDARALALLPSVTNILSVLARPGLEAWKQEQMILSALTLPRVHGETDDAFAKRVVADAREQAEHAAEFGSAVHAFIAAWHQHQNPSIPAGADAICTAYIQFAARRMTAITAEKSFAAQMGYGGCADFIGHLDGALSVIDFKTRTTIPNKPVPVYDTDGLQLVAYANGLGMSSARLVNLILSTSEPGRMDVVDWTDRKEDLWSVFTACFRIWKWQKKYNPKEEM